MKIAGARLTRMPVVPVVFHKLFRFASCIIAILYAYKVNLWITLAKLLLYIMQARSMVKTQGHTVYESLC